MKIFIVDCGSNEARLQFVRRQMLLSLPIICEKPNTFLTNLDSEAAASFLYQWIHHSCKRDHPELVKQVQHAKTELQQVLDYKFDAKKLLKIADYYPLFSDGLSSPKQVTTADLEVTISDTPASFLDLQSNGRESRPINLE